MRENNQTDSLLTTSPSALAASRPPTSNNTTNEDPLRPPSSSNHHHSSSYRRPPLPDPSSTQWKASEAQLKAALDRFGMDIDMDNVDEQQQQQQQSLEETPNTTTTNTTMSSSPFQIIAGAVACLCSATLGAGILSLPYAMAQSGIVCGMIMLVMSAAATNYSIQCLVQAMHVLYHTTTHTTTQQEKTYEDVVESILGKPARTLAEASMLLFCGGGAVAYVIAVGDILQYYASRRSLAMIIMWSAAMLPLSLLRTMKSLQCTSSIGIASIATLVLAALFHYLECYDNNDPEHDDGDEYTEYDYDAYIVFVGNQTDDDDHSHHTDNDDTTTTTQSILWPTGGLLSILRACPIILFAFSCQVNVCAIYDELPAATTMDTTVVVPPPEQHDNNNNNNQEEGDPETDTSPPPQQQQQQLDHSYHQNKLHRMDRVTWIAVAICAFLYTSISIIALLDFGSIHMTPNILSSYNPESIMQVAFVGMALAVVLAYPMNIFPARVTLLGILSNYKQAKRQQQQLLLLQQQQSNDNDLAEPLLPSTTNTTSTNTTNNNSNNNDASNDTGATAAVGTTATTATTAAATTANNDITTNNNNDDDNDNSLLEHVVATLVLAGGSLGLALVAPNISVVFGLLGGTSSSVLGFVIPGLLGYYTAEDFYSDYFFVGESNAVAAAAAAIQRTKVLSMMLVLGGIVVGILTTAVTVYSTFADSSTSSSSTASSLSLSWH